MNQSCLVQFVYQFPSFLCATANSRRYVFKVIIDERRAILIFHLFSDRQLQPVTHQGVRQNVLCCQVFVLWVLRRFFIKENFRQFGERLCAFALAERFVLRDNGITHFSSLMSVLYFPVWLVPNFRETAFATLRSFGNSSQTEKFRFPWFFSSFQIKLDRGNEPKYLTSPTLDGNIILNS